MDKELAALVAQIEGSVPPPGPFPTPSPTGGQTENEWKADVTRLRSQHDAAALESQLFPPNVLAPATAELSVAYHDIPVDGTWIGGRSYVPPGADMVPGLVLLHGGAWWMGGGATGFALNDRLCRLLAAELGAVVLNLDYRLAPEHPYPTQTDDGLAAIEWLGKGDLPVDPDRIGVVGISSGGNVAASLALLTGDRGGPALRLLVLLAPALSMTLASDATGADPDLVEVARRLRALYFQGEPDFTDPYISPVMASDLSRLPPTIVVTGEFDPLRGGGTRLVSLLGEAGVKARLLEYPATHTVATPEVAARREADLLAAVREWL